MEKQNVQTMPRRQKSDVLNLFKGLACISVVFVHVHFPGITGIVVHRSFSSFAVPLFLMIAGYFAFGKDESVIKRRFFKILKIFLWSYAVFLVLHILFKIPQGAVVEWLSLNFDYTTPIKYIVFCTIDFAIPLWYLIAMVETYFVWYFVVKHKKEHCVVFAIPFLFVFKVVLTTYCESMHVPWMFKMNFLSEAMSFFLFGYFLHSKENLFKSIPYSVLLLTLFAGCAFAAYNVASEAPVKMFSLGTLFYSLAVFVIAIKIPNKTYCRPLEYIGDKLSLNVYIFHPIIGLVMLRLCQSLFGINLQAGLLGWLRPFAVVVLSIVVAQILECLNSRKLFTLTRADKGGLFRRPIT